MSHYYHDMIVRIISDDYEKKMNEAKTEEEKRKIQERFDSLDYSEIIDKMIQAASGTILKDMTKTMYEQVLDFRAEEDEFLAIQKQKWNKAFVASEALYIMNLEFVENYSKYVASLEEERKRPFQWRYLAMQHIHGRALQIYLEIITLMKNGFADGAYSRWRTMYELAVVCDFISEHDENTAKTYYERSNSEDHQYEWASVSGEFPIKKPEKITFADIRSKTTLNTTEWYNQYKLANKIAHASPQGTFKRLSNTGRKNLIPVGRSDFGITTPGEHSAITLVQITTMFGILFADIDTMVELKIQNNWIDVVRKSYFEIHDELFPDMPPLMNKIDDELSEE